MSALIPSWTVGAFCSVSSGNHCQSWHFPTGCWHKRQIKSSVGIYRSWRLEISPLTSSDGLILGDHHQPGGPQPKGPINSQDLHPTLAPFQFLRYLKLVPTSGLWPFCFFCLGFSFPTLPPSGPSVLSLNAQSPERPSLTLLCRLRMTPLLRCHPRLKYISCLTLAIICNFEYIV